jgi:ribosomal protein S18 acetylase RimI-like enzyme
MSVVIRRACGTDALFLSQAIQELQELHSAAMPELFKPTIEPYTPEKLSDLLSNPMTHLFIADVAGQPVGFAHFWKFDEPEGENNFPNSKIFISYVYVQSERRRNGIGRALIVAAQNLAEELKASSIELNVMAFNASARDFFLKCGFRTLREILFQKVAPN